MGDARSYKYVIVGGGMVAGYAIKGIRQKDPSGSILVISKEADVTYERPALTKKLWLDNEFTEEDIKIGAENHPNVTFKFNTTVNKINRQYKTIMLTDNPTIHYEQLLLATGSEPRSIKGPADPHVLVFRKWSDYRKLRKFSGENKHVVIIGGGYVGTELASSLTQNNTKVTMIFPKKKLGEGKFPEDIRAEYEATFKKNGVEILSNQLAQSYQRRGDHLIVVTKDGSEITADTIIIGLGVTPRIELAQDSKLILADGGVKVNKYLQTSDPSIWSAGDIASYPDQILGRQRIEHVDHARFSGELVGQNMAGAHLVYKHTPYFYSMIFDISWKAVGNINPVLQSVFDQRNHGYIIYFLDKDKLVGVLIWNVSVDLDDVRSLLADPPANNNDLVGSIKEK
ncbi:pyridine nucleotide-disulfide oxidoreductase [Oenococcus oeni S25]|uniref:NAD(P)/FAD-dependent oxidoreductase n=4 Tax=Oenococcus oeni TaxID=1247 RepID=UPI00050E3141|nr:NAD(P)/FAD-dependent oxidoreductase [Oenococcus oeni]KGH71072.1 pyridine nucleotide-disulfide oxidoreductase [Oenococcus oeni S25]KGH80482.1 pyridine nucleotide-disulfide oxidoreductase [Oenococcus oeni IOEB_0607]KGH90207.1 pyridine nucleotide-disulfide oxidoreductase [Oenococcus oeni IOEB_L26_1]KGO17193.1 pyridine nucleotide-disulfide oxidoreductase [Oenococcus oeni X2L]